MKFIKFIKNNKLRKNIQKKSKNFVKHKLKTFKFLKN